MVFVILHSSLLTDGCVCTSISTMVRDSIAKSYSFCKNCVRVFYGSGNGHFTDQQHSGERFYACLKEGCLHPPSTGEIFPTFSGLNVRHKACRGMKVTNHLALAIDGIAQGITQGMVGYPLNPPKVLILTPTVALPSASTSTPPPPPPLPMKRPASPLSIVPPPQRRSFVPGKRLPATPAHYVSLLDSPLSPIPDSPDSPPPPTLSCYASPTSTPPGSPNAASTPFLNTQEVVAGLLDAELF